MEKKASIEGYGIEVGIVGGKEEGLEGGNMMVGSELILGVDISGK